MALREPPKTIEWLGDRVRFIDQTRLPHELVYKETDDYRELAESIRRLEVRGAPAIGVAAAFGVALAGLVSGARGLEGVRSDVAEAAERLASTRPTAVNLRWAVDRMLAVSDGPSATDPDALRRLLVEVAVAVFEEDR